MVNGTKVTLIDIGKMLGVSASTVQRALNGLEGVGKERREAIRRAAEAMGYKRNLTASALKTGARTIGVVLPEPMNNNRFYARFLWEGALRCSGEYRDFNLNVAEFTYVRTPERHAAKLREVLERHGDGLSGILTMGAEARAAGEAFAGFREKKIPVVLVGTDARAEDRLCCVRTHDEMAGRMAADLLISFAPPKKGGKVIMTGDFSIPDQFFNARGFERHIRENNAPLEVLRLVNDPDLDAVRRNIAKILDRDRGVRAVYATSSRNTVPLCQAVEESGRRVHAIGSDIFPESVDFLRRSTLSAIIHKRPSDQAYQAMRTLVDIVVKGETLPRDTIQVDSVIVMKSNLECFLDASVFRHDGVTTGT